MKDKYGRQYSCLLPDTTPHGEKEAQEDSGPQVRFRVHGNEWSHVTSCCMVTHGRSDHLQC